MRRRTLFQALAAVLFAASPARAEWLSQGRPDLTPAQLATLEAVAEVVLPTALGAAGRAHAVSRFVGWIHDYREGADRGHGYGASTLNPPTGPLPALRYPEQFAALDALAAAAGAVSFAALPLDARVRAIETALDQPARIAALPSRPNGNSLVADFMGYYFASDAAYDLAYQAAIGRDQCRGLEGSAQRPAALEPR